MLFRVVKERVSALLWLCHDPLPVLVERPTRIVVGRRHFKPVKFLA